MKAEKDKAYILHRRPFKESSVIIESFCREQGLMTLIARGAKRARSRFDALLQPFVPLDLEWGGKTELKTLFKAESHFLLPLLKDNKLILGLYLNELMMRLLQRLDPHPPLFDIYHHTLKEIAQEAELKKTQSLLRQFELKLLAELGYGLELGTDARTGQAVEADLLYSYDPKCGVYEISHLSVQPSCSISGASLIALLNNNLVNETTLHEAKVLMRFVLSHYLGNKPLQTRKLFFPA